MICNTDSINTSLIIHSSINSDAIIFNDVLNNEPLKDDTSMNDETNGVKIISLYLISMLNHVNLEFQKVNVNKARLIKKSRSQRSDEFS